jgi:hypothetical protein
MQCHGKSPVPYHQTRAHGIARWHSMRSVHRVHAAAEGYIATELPLRQLSAASASLRLTCDRIQPGLCFVVVYGRWVMAAHGAHGLCRPAHGQQDGSWTVMASGVSRRCMLSRGSGRHSKQRQHNAGDGAYACFGGGVLR